MFILSISCLSGGQTRDVQLCPRHDLRPHRMALPDPVRHPPAGRAHRAQAESHLQDRLRQQVRIRSLEAFIPLTAYIPLSSYLSGKMTLVGIGQQCQSIENDRSSLSLRTNWRDLASANRTVFHHEMTAPAVSAVELEKSVEN